MKLANLFENSDLNKAIRMVRNLVSNGKNYAVAIDQASKEYGVSTKTISNKFNPPKKKIIWTKPNLEDEIGEYFENPVTRKFFAKMGYVFRDRSELMKFLESGKLKKLSRISLYPSENLTTNPDDFKLELEDEDYAESYNSMKRELDKGKTITLEAPIIIKFPKTYYGFAGNRRMNLAWNNGLDVKFWVVEAADASPKQESLF